MGDATGKGAYYTRSRKASGRVVREYVGTGLVGELAARRDTQDRERNAGQRAATNAELARVDEADAVLAELCDLSDALVGAVLVAAGFHQHRGQWRKRRGGAGDGQDPIGG